MHLIDTGNAAAGTNGAPIHEFDEGDPLVPRLGTQVDKHILNAFMMEIANMVTSSGITLVKGTNTQLRDAIHNLTTKLSVAINGAAEALSVANAGSGTAAVIGANTGKAIDASASGTVATALVQNIGGTGPALELAAPDGRWPLKLTPRATLPTTNPAGGALSAADDGAIVYLAGAYNKLYCYSNGTGWNALW